MDEAASTEEDDTRDWDRNSICCRLSSICTDAQTWDHLNLLVERRTRIGFEVAKFLTAFVLHSLEKPDARSEPMWTFDQDIVDRAWMILSTEDGEVFKHEDAAPRKKPAAPKRSAATIDMMLRKKKDDSVKREAKFIARCEKAATTAHRKEIERGTKRKRDPSSVDEGPPCAKMRYDEILQQKIARGRARAAARREKALEGKERKDEERARNKVVAKARTQIIKREMYEYFLKVWQPLRGAKFVVPDRAGLNQIRQMARKEYLTSAKNNVALNFEKRTLKWIRHRIRLHLWAVTGKSVSGKKEAKLLYRTAQAVYQRSWTFDLDSEDHQIPDFPDFLKEEKHAEKLAIATKLEEEIVQFRRDRSIPAAGERNLGSNFQWFLFLPWMKAVAMDFEAWIEEYEQGKDDKGKMTTRQCPFEGSNTFPSCPSLIWRTSLSA